MSEYSDNIDLVAFSVAVIRNITSHSVEVKEELAT